MPKWTLKVLTFKVCVSIRCIICVVLQYRAMILVMQRFRVVFRRISHGYTTKKGCITVSYHAIENTDGKVGCDTVELHESMGRFGGILTNILRLAFLHSDWLYFLWHGIKCSMLCLLLLILFCSQSIFSLTTEQQEFCPCPHRAGEI